MNIYDTTYIKIRRRIDARGGFGCERKGYLKLVCGAICVVCVSGRKGYYYDLR